MGASTHSRPSYSLLDPNPSLIDIDGSLIDNINLAANLTTHCNGTIADGISKLVLIVESGIPLQFSINVKSPNSLTNGTLSSLERALNVNNLSSSTKGRPHNTTNGKSIVAVVYTPPWPVDEFRYYMGNNQFC